MTIERHRLTIYLDGGDTTNPYTRRKLRMRLSARNQLNVTIDSVHLGEVMIGKPG